MADVTLQAPGRSPHYTKPQRIEVNGLPVAYRRKGERRGEGPPTVFLHGAGTTQLWLPFYERMAAAVDFVAPEHPGFGGTPLPDWVEGFDDLVLHYRDLLDAFAFDQVHLIGFSLGGWIAAELGVFYPERLASLTLITPVGLRVPGHPLPDLFRMPPENIPELLYNGRAQDYPDFLLDPHDVEAVVQGYTEASTFARLAWNPRHDRKLARRLGRIRCRALVVEPDEDQLVPRQHFEAWVELLPDARLERVRGAAHPTGHGLIVQEPDQAAALITRFIQEQEAGS